MGAGLGLPPSGWAWVSGLGVLAGDAGTGTCRAREGEGVEVTASGQAVTGLRSVCGGTGPPRWKSRQVGRQSSQGQQHSR